MTVFFTSDEHYGHSNIILYSSRPFSCIEDMHEQLIDRHNAVVRDGDVVYHVGDFALDERLVARILPRLRGKHYLVAGNHDKCHPMRSRAAAFGQKYLLWGFSGVYLELHYDGFVINHLPYAGDHTEQVRFPEWRPVDVGSWLLHGHVHELWKVNGRQINVGVDQWGYAPVSLDTLKELRS